MEKIRINGSICLSDISEQYKKGHSAFSKVTDKNGVEKIYMSFTGWCNDCTDTYKDFSLQLNSKQDKQEAEGKVYVGNGKIKPTTAIQTPTAQAASSTPSADKDDLPW